MEGSATEVKPTLADHLARIPAIKSLNAVEDGAVELLKHASRTMVCLSSVNSNELKQQELEEHCTNYMNLLKEIRNYVKFAEAAAAMTPPLLTGTNTAHIDWIRFDIAAARAASVHAELGSIADAFDDMHF